VVDVNEDVRCSQPLAEINAEPTAESEVEEPPEVIDMTNPEVKLEYLQNSLMNFNQKFSFEMISFNKVTSFKNMIRRAEKRDKLDQVNKQTLLANFAYGHKAMNKTHAELTEKIMIETQNVIAQEDAYDEDSSLISESSLRDQFDEEDDGDKKEP
jgi:hypothetical protein